MSSLIQRYHRVFILLIWLFASILVIMAVNSWFAGQFIQQSFQEFYQTHLTQNSQLIEQALENALMLNDWEMVQDQIANLSQLQNMQRIRLLNGSGEILASTIPIEKNVTVNQNGAPCNVCHLTSEKPTMNLAQIAGNPEQEPYILVAKGIENQIACQGCHNSSQATLGVLLIEYQPTALDVWLKSLNLQLLGAVAISAVLLLSSVYFITTRVFIRPMDS
ncbi:MAG TPA: hypothetical protein VLM80_02680, partial [Anaerolineales bacterium]|nr:hypothetical protein [Anaerolineales bacterium]